MRKINDKVLLQLHEEGKEQKEIAAHFGCSPAAICKRLKRLQSVAARRAILGRLSAKEEKFVLEIARGQNQTQAAVAAFDVGSLDSAKSIGSRLMKQPDIREAIDAVLATEGLTKTHLVRRLKDHVDQEADPGVSLRAVETGLKLHDAFPAAKSVNLNLTAEIDHPFDLSMFRRQ